MTGLRRMTPSHNRAKSRAGRDFRREPQSPGWRMIVRQTFSAQRRMSLVGT
jgi:hypothetical protein